MSNQHRTCTATIDPVQDDWIFEENQKLDWIQFGWLLDLATRIILISNQIVEIFTGWLVASPEYGEKGPLILRWHFPGSRSLAQHVSFCRLTSPPDLI